MSDNILKIKKSMSKNLIQIYQRPYFQSKCYLFWPLDTIRPLKNQGTNAMTT